MTPLRHFERAYYKRRRAARYARPGGEVWGVRGLVFLGRGDDLGGSGLDTVANQQGVNRGFLTAEAAVQFGGVLGAAAAENVVAE